MNILPWARYSKRIWSDMTRISLTEHTLRMSKSTVPIRKQQQQQRKRYTGGGRGGCAGGDQVRQMIQMIMCPSSFWLWIEGGGPLPLIIWVSGPGAGGPTWRWSTSQTNAQTARWFAGSQSMMRPRLIKWNQNANTTHAQIDLWISSSNHKALIS